MVPSTDVKRYGRYTGRSLCWFMATFLMPVTFCNCTGKGAYIFNILHPIDTRKTGLTFCRFCHRHLSPRDHAESFQIPISREIKIKSFKDSNHIIRDRAETYSQKRPWHSLFKNNQTSLSVYLGSWSVHRIAGQVSNLFGKWQAACKSGRCTNRVH